MLNYTPFGNSDWHNIVAKVKQFASAGKKTAVISTINGDANISFYTELATQGIIATDIPVMAFSVGEAELANMDVSKLVGHFAAWNYFQSVDAPENQAFIEHWHTFIKNLNRVTNDPMEATYIGFKMWVQSVLQAQTTAVDAVRQAMYGQVVRSPSGYNIIMNSNHHLSKPVLIGKIRADGQFDVVWQTMGPIKADAWSPFIPNRITPTADWTFPWGCGECVEPKFSVYK